MDFEGKIVVVTGAGQGVGHAIAKRMVAEGATVYCIGRTEEKILRTVNELGERAIPCTMDVSDEARWIELASLIKEKHGHLDVLVNNAAHFVFKDTDEISLEEFQYVLASNVEGPFLAIKYLMGLLKACKGNVVNISSIGSKRSGDLDSGQAGYSASKNAMNGFARFTASRVAKDGVRVNSVLPGPINTPALQGYVAEHPDAFEKFRCILPPYATEPDDITDAVMFLANNRIARCITGAELVVDCGVLTN